MSTESPTDGNDESTLTLNKNEASGDGDQPSSSLPSISNLQGLQIIAEAAGHRDNNASNDERYCWVCFANDDDDSENLQPQSWVIPCKCRGTTKWVHQSCLQRWVDEKQKGNSFRRVSCPQCQTEYIIVFPSMGTIANVLEAIDTLIKRVSPFITAGFIVGSLYWTAVCYGAITVLQVVGHAEGLQLMETADPLVLLIGLPAVPVCLVLGRMIRWEDAILRFIQSRKSSRKFRLLSLVFPVPDEEPGQDAEGQNNQNPAIHITSDTLSATRVLCGGLFLPTVATIVGRLFFDSIKSNVQRTLVGGFAFVAVKGILKIYFKQKQHVRKQHRKILDYTEENVSRYSVPLPSVASNSRPPTFEDFY